MSDAPSLLSLIRPVLQNEWARVPAHDRQAAKDRLRLNEYRRLMGHAATERVTTPRSPKWDEMIEVAPTRPSALRSPRLAVAVAFLERELDGEGWRDAATVIAAAERTGLSRRTLK